MTDSRAFLAVDWGTTNRRVYRIAGGVVEQTERDDRGILAIGPGGFPSEAIEIRARMGDLPMLCAGMVGSNRGWIDVPYVDCPTGLASLAAGVAWIETGRTAIAPGVAQRGTDHNDVMRGEEVQLLGAVAARLVPENALLCQPGTHCKWARVRAGAIVSFATAMTGELFALLQQHSLLAAQLAGNVALDADFRRGMADAADNALLTRLFGARADFVTERRGDGAASYISGLLIGTDVRSQVVEDEQVFLLADPQLGALYAAAIEAAGGCARRIDSQAAFAAGITAIWDLLL